MTTLALLDRDLTARIKAGALRVVTGSGLAHVCRPLTRRAAIIFMLHRFNGAGGPTRAYDPSLVRSLLAYLRRENYELVDLATMLGSLNGEGLPLQHAVAFTIDDGYAEQATIAAPLFAEFDCPVTTFVTTGFLDGALWFWWDQIEYIFAHAAGRTISIELEGAAVVYELRDRDSRRSAKEDFTSRCRGLREHRKREAITQLAAAAEVTLPRRAPAEYAPMSWEQLRACERRGMTFGPHTVTHPILATISDEQARVEIAGSWDRLRSEAANPLPIFAYPNGQPGDFGEREVELLRDAGLRGAVTSVAGFVTPRRLHTASASFLLPRFPFPGSLSYLIQQVGGLERLKFMLRGVE